MPINNDNDELINDINNLNKKALTIFAEACLALIEKGEIYAGESANMKEQKDLLAEIESLKIEVAYQDRRIKDLHNDLVPDLYKLVRCISNEAIKAEREACAKLCESESLRWIDGPETAKAFAGAIRDRK